MRKKDFQKDIVSKERKAVSFVISLIGTLRLFCKKSPPTQCNRILVMQWGYLGDIVLSTPALRALRQIYPSAEISLLTNPENKSYIDSFPFVNKIIYMKNPLHFGRRKFSVNDFLKCVLSLRKVKYDLVIELTGRLTDQVFLPFLKAGYTAGQDPANNFYFLYKRINSGRKYQVERDLDVVKGVSQFPLSEYSKFLWNPVTDEDRFKIKCLLRTRGVGDKYIVVHTSSSWKPRQWPNERWVEVINFLLNKEKAIIFIGVSKEYRNIEEVRKRLENKNSFNFAGLINIHHVIALMENAEIFLGVDSGPMHLAAIANLKGVVLFGAGDPIKWAYPLHTIIFKKPECGPCPQFAFKKVCPKGLTICKGLLDITAKEVIGECEKILFKNK